VSKTYRSQFNTKEKNRVKARKANKLLRQKIFEHDSEYDYKDKLD
jgi:hypothetical protein